MDAWKEEVAISYDGQRIVSAGIPPQQSEVRYGTQPGRAAACRTHVANCASSSSSSSWMSR